MKLYKDFDISNITFGPRKRVQSIEGVMSLLTTNKDFIIHEENKKIEKKSSNPTKMNKMKKFQTKNDAKKLKKINHSKQKAQVTLKISKKIKKK